MLLLLLWELELFGTYGNKLYSSNNDGNGKKGGRINMDTVLTMITWLIGKAAESGAGFFSWGAGYQPEIPEGLIK